MGPEILGLAAAEKIKKAHDEHQQNIAHENDVAEQQALNGSQGHAEYLMRTANARILHKRIIAGVAAVAFGVGAFGAYKGVEAVTGVVGDGIHAIEDGASSLGHFGGKLPGKLNDFISGGHQYHFTVKSALDHMQKTDETVLARGEGTSTGRIDVDGGLPIIHKCLPFLGCVTHADAEETRKVAVELRAKNPSPKERAIEIIPQHIEGAPEDKGWQILAKVHIEDLYSARVEPETATNKDRTLSVHTSSGFLGALLSAVKTGVTLGKYQDQGTGRRVSFVGDFADKSFQQNCAENAKYILDKAVVDNIHGTFYGNIQTIEQAPGLDPKVKKSVAGFYRMMANPKTAPVTVEYVRGKGKDEHQVSLYTYPIQDLHGKKPPTPKDAAAQLKIDAKHVKLSPSAKCEMKPTAIKDQEAIFGRHLARPDV